LGRHCRRRKTPENPFHLPEDRKLIIYNPFVDQITVHNSPPQHLAIDAWLRRCRSCAPARTQGRGGRCLGGGGKVNTGRGGGGGGQHLGLGFPGLGVRVLGVLHSPAAEGEAAWERRRPSRVGWAVGGDRWRGCEKPSG
jgi:hypothetical protein